MKKQIIFFSLLIIGLMCRTFPAWAVQDGIVINEVMFMPATGSEWVELYNASGEPRDLDKVWFFDFSKTGNEWKDLTVAANEIDDDFVPLGNMAPEDFLYVGRSNATFQAISIILGFNINTVSSSIKAEYWNGSDWQDLFATDGTISGGVTLSQNGDISWSIPSDWEVTEINGVSAYYSRLSVDNTLSSNVDIDVTDYRDGLEIDIADYDITNAADDTYTIPAALPPVPPGAFVVINFDGMGSGADDYDFSDAVAELHTSSLTGNVFTDVEDSVILYSGTPHDESTKKDFVAWGDYPQHDNYINTSGGRGTLRYPGSGRSIGLHPEMYFSPFRCWVVYLENNVTKGSANPIPSALLTEPFPNDVFLGGIIAFAWDVPACNIKCFRLQVDIDPAFISPIINVEVNTSFYITPIALPPGTYYWRVIVIDKTGKIGKPSAANIFKIRPTPPGLPVTKDLGVKPILKTKDTKLVCLECESDHGRHSWDNIHDAKAYTFSDHSRCYCYAGCIKMMAAYYGGNLSMDRIAYKIGKSEGLPEDHPKIDLRHNRGAGDIQIKNALAWTLSVPDAAIVYKYEAPTFNEIKEWIDKGKPFIMGIPGHVVVIDGYSEFPSGEQKVHYICPDFGKEVDKLWTSVRADAYWVLKDAVIAKGISDEPSISTDPDNDGRPRFVSGKWDGKDHNPWGLMTFDEEKRFKTDPNDEDSDGDCVQDKVEVWSYVFGKGKIVRKPDQDGDGIRAEKDSDMDDGGFADGDEDTNLDGDLDAGETDPFKSDDDSDPILVEYFFQGTSPPVPGIDGKGKSWATLALSTDDKKFRFRSADKILDEIDTQKAIVADMWREIPGNPARIIFTGTNAGVKFYGNVLLENYLRAVVDVTKNNKRVRYLLKACKP